jgi:serine/threonine protein kinase
LEFVIQVDEIAHSYGTLNASGLRLVNFANLMLGSGSVLGAGGTAKVLLGSLDGAIVAVKMLYPTDFTYQKVQRFAKECQMLGQLHHPNIIEIKGICIVPPSVCLCMELAARGSLYDEVSEN